MRTADGEQQQDGHAAGPGPCPALLRGGSSFMERRADGSQPLSVPDGHVAQQVGLRSSPPQRHPGRPVVGRGVAVLRGRVVEEAPAAARSPAAAACPARATVKTGWRAGAASRRPVMPAARRRSAGSQEAARRTGSAGGVVAVARPAPSAPGGPAGATGGPSGGPVRRRRARRRPAAAPRGRVARGDVVHVQRREAARVDVAGVGSAAVARPRRRR